MPLLWKCIFVLLSIEPCWGTRTETFTETLSATESESVSETQGTRTLTDSQTESISDSDSQTESESMTESLSLPTGTESLSETFPTPIIRLIASPDCETVSETEIACDARSSEFFNISISGDGFPLSVDKVTSVLLVGQPSSQYNHPTCVPQTLTKTGEVDLNSGLSLTMDRITCALNATNSGGRYAVKLVLYDGSLEVVSNLVYVTLSTMWDDHSWPVDYRVGTTYSEQTRITLKTEAVQDGDELFLVWHTDNCTNPTAARSTSVFQANVSSTDAFVILDTSGLPEGQYYLCHRPLGLSYVLQEQVPITLRGGIDPYQSIPCCSSANNSMIAGDVVVCDIITFDANGNPTGAVEDECHFGFTILKDGAGDSVCAHDTRPTLQPEAGHFQFSFTPYASGCLSRVGITYRDVLLSGKVLMLTILPGEPVTHKATSKCQMSADGDLQCDITKRDQHNNPVEICHTSYGNDPFVHCDKL